MVASLPHYKSGPMNKQAAVLIFGGQFVQPNTLTAGTTDLTVKLAVPFATSQPQAEATLGCAGNDANVVAVQSGAANAYGQPLIDISVLTDYVAVYYGGVDMPVWYSAAATEGQLLVINTTFGTVGPYTSQAAAFAQASGDFASVVGRCTHPGGVSAGMLTMSIGGGAGGGGTSVYFLGRARVF